MNNWANTTSWITLITILFTISCSENAKHENVVIKTIIKDTLTQKIEVEKKLAQTDTILSRIFSSINLNKIKHCTTSSGPMTFKPSSIYYRPNSNKDGFIGHYFLLNCGDKSYGKPYKATAKIYGQKQPWSDTDTTEILLDLHVFSPTIVIAPFLKIGNPIDGVLNTLGEPKVVSEKYKDGTLYYKKSRILFYQEKNVILAIHLCESKILSIKIGKYNTSKYTFEDLENQLIEEILGRAFYEEEGILHGLK